VRCDVDKSAALDAVISLTIVLGDARRVPAALRTRLSVATIATSAITTSTIRPTIGQRHEFLSD